MKNNKESIQLQVGAFTAVGLFLVMLIIFLLGNEKNLFESQYSLYCRFDDISGLRVGAPVQLAGIQAGNVNQISFDDKDPTKVKLVLRLSERFKNKIRQDSEASIVSQGLLGDKMLFLTVGVGERALEEGEEIKSAGGSGFSEVLKDGHNTIVSAQEAIKKINGLLDEVEKGKGVIHTLVYDDVGGDVINNVKDITSDLRKIVQNVSSITGKVLKGEGTLGALVRDPSIYNQLKVLLGKADRNKLIKAVIRYTLKTKDEKLLTQ